MAKLIFFFAFALMAVAVSSAPADQIYVEVEEVPEQNVVLFEPSPRVTCDLLSWLPINHSLCAAHCIARGFRGGACGSDGICRCRN